MVSRWLYAAAALLFATAVAFDIQEQLDRKATWEEVTDVTDIGKDTEPKSA